MKQICVALHFITTCSTKFYHCSPGALLLLVESIAAAVLSNEHAKLCSK